MIFQDLSRLWRIIVINPIRNKIPGYSSAFPEARNGIVNHSKEMRISSAPRTTPLYISGCFSFLRGILKGYVSKDKAIRKNFELSELDLIFTNIKKNLRLILTKF
jgi:hypothetical protein